MGYVAFFETKSGQHSKPNSEGSPLASKKTLAIIGIVAALVLVAIIALIAYSCARGGAQDSDASSSAISESSSTSSSSTSSSASSQSADSSVNLASAYDIAGVLGLESGQAKAWLAENKFTEIPNGEGGFYRLVIDGEDVEGSANPDDYAGWKSLSAESYTFFSSLSGGSDAKACAQSPQGARIEPANLASEAPRAARLSSTMRSQDSLGLLSSAKAYLEQCVKVAGLSAIATSQDGDSCYSIGTCRINEQDGIWIGCCGVDSSGNFETDILCGFADDMKTALGLDSDSDDALASCIGASATASTFASGGSAQDSPLVGTWVDSFYGDTLTLQPTREATIVQDDVSVPGTWTPTADGLVLNIGNQSYTFDYTQGEGKEQIYCKAKELTFER